MIKQIQLAVSPQEASGHENLKSTIARTLSIPESEINHIQVLKRSVDARSRNIKVNITADVFVNESAPEVKNYAPHYEYVGNKKRVIVVGAGPAGLFAALRLIELGMKPIVVERGKDVQARRRDLAAIHKQHIVNADSNYCFGEGGAGTYSDGKLYTRSTKRGDINRVLETLVAHGASEEILVDAHPHIGTNKLPKIIQAMRNNIIQAGGEVLFNKKVIDIILSGQQARGVVVADTVTNRSEELMGEAVILATGHSARDIYELLHRKNILIEAKPFAMGVRIEHPQELIDSIQYHCNGSKLEELRNYLPASPYSLVQQSNGRGVYSFCMCPGGIIAPCATSPGEVVTNGWSPSKRNNPFANSGIVVGIELMDLKPFEQFGVFAGLEFQRSQERMAFNAGGQTQTAPAQRMVDFVNGKFSTTLPETSYQPGVKSVPLHELLHPHIGKRLQHGLKEFGNKMRGYLTNDAVVVGVESRTSSPVRIPRNRETWEHPHIQGLYPVGEGAGFAGGIVSAAIDGQKAAEMIGLSIG